MKIIFNLRHRKSLDRGFTTLEILISIIIALAFVSVALQSFVLAMSMKVQAQEKQRANQLIQEDLERLASLGSNIAAEDTSGATTHTFIQRCNAEPAGGGTVAYANGFAQELWEDIRVITPPTARLLKSADGTEAGKTLTLARTHVSGGNPSATPVIPVSSTTPHRTLKIDYQVTDPDGDVIAERYVEVIPDVALQCP